jgi:hypothetical protein
MRTKPLVIDSKMRTQRQAKCGPIAPVTRFLCVSWYSGTLRRGVMQVDVGDARAWQMDETERGRKVGQEYLTSELLSTVERCTAEDQWNKTLCQPRAKESCAG